MSIFLGAFIGWFFGMLIATMFEITARERGFTDAERAMRAMERDVERDERLARFRGV